MKTKTVIAAIICANALSCWSALSETKGTKDDQPGGKDDPMAKFMPWLTDDPTVVKLNPKDETIGLWNARNEKGGTGPLKGGAGPIDVQRYALGFNWQAFPTFYGRPIALTTEDLRAGDVDVAIVGSLTDNNFVRGTANEINHYE